MSVEFGFDLKDALFDAIEAACAAAVDGDPFFGVDAYESWPDRGVQGKRSVLVLDFEGDERAATLRAGGGTRDDVVLVDVVVAVWDKASTAREVRGMTKPISNAVKAMIRAEARAKPAGVFGVTGARQPEVRHYKVLEYAVEGGRRECDVRLTVQFVGRNRAT